MNDEIVENRETDEYERERKYARVCQLRTEIQAAKAEINQLKRELGLDPDVY
jgi:hypothetical protein